jgi:hypothetical protein
MATGDQFEPAFSWGRSIHRDPVSQIGARHWAHSHSPRATSGLRGTADALRRRFEDESITLYDIADAGRVVTSKASIADRATLTAGKTVSGVTSRNYDFVAGVKTAGL